MLAVHRLERIMRDVIKAEGHKEIQKQNAEIAVLKDAVDEAEELKKVNAVLVDVIEELKDEDAEADSNIS